MNKEYLYKLESVEEIKMFLTGGKAIITLESKRTGKWFTYKINKAKKSDDKSPYFVSLLTGLDNNSAYSYMGTIFNNDNKQVFRLTKKSNMGKDALSVKAFSFFFDLLNNNRTHEEINFYHRGVCCVCGRQLTTPESLVAGIGPFCRGTLKR